MKVTFANNFFGPDGVFYKAREPNQRPIVYDLPDSTPLPRGAMRVDEQGGEPAPVRAVGESAPANKGKV
jgi:hypothetical protein